MHNHLIQKMLRDKAVYWAPLGIDRHGQMTFAPPVEVKCRWDNVTEQFLDRNGNLAMSKAKVYVEIDVEELGVLWQGELKDATDLDNPFDNGSTAYEVRRSTKFPNARQDNYLREVYL